MNDNHFWTERDLAQIVKATQLSQVLEICLTVIGHIPIPVAMVSGPITTGGFNSLEKNLQVFQAVINKLARRGHNVFSQMPAENFMVQLWRDWRTRGNEDYCWPLLHDFYRPLFHSGKIHTMFFIPGWEKSFGASWEHDECGKVSIQRIKLQPSFIAPLGF